ncbi:MAG: type II secretion system GspH family protein [Clostridiaceae bacterium]|jgi:prepilin-type N-terminal cleavage/methylation domain-containing protein|nr:type II secretion system GspH family protein [Clostridiaceae bacterium]
MEHTNQILWKSKAFTLAEVLITLAIIGIVAALTLPIFYNNYQKKVYSEQLKVSYSILSTGFKQMLFNSEVTKFEESEAYGELQKKGFDISGYGDSNIVEIELMKKYFNAPVQISYSQQVKEGWPNGNNVYTGDTCKKFAGKGSTWYKRSRKSCIGLRQNVYKLANGSLVRMGFLDAYPEVENSGHMKRMIAEVTIDVNGEKGPNAFGSDAFEFALGNDGNLYAWWDDSFARYFAAVYNDDYANYYYVLKDGTDLCKDLLYNGRACAAYAEEHDWDLY